MSIKHLWCVIFLSVLIWSKINPKDQLTWFPEVVPAMIGAGLLAGAIISLLLLSKLHGKKL